MDPFGDVLSIFVFFNIRNVKLHYLARSVQYYINPKKT